MDMGNVCVKHVGASQQRTAEGMRRIVLLLAFSCWRCTIIYYIMLSLAVSLCARSVDRRLVAIHKRQLPEARITTTFFIPASMGFEDTRRRLMSRPFGWGDCPPTQSHGGQNHEEARARESNIALASATVETTFQTDSSSDPIALEMQVIRPPPPMSNDGFTCRGWSLENLLSSGKNFHPVKRVSSTDTAEVLDAIQHHEDSGEPLIIEGYHTHPDWPQEEFGIDWFREHSQEGEMMDFSYFFLCKNLPFSSRNHRPQCPRLFRKNNIIGRVH